MQATLTELAAMVHGHLLGPEDLMIQGAAPLWDARPGQITLVNGDDKNRNLDGCQATAVICPRGFIPRGYPAIQVDDVHRAFASIITYFQPPRFDRRVGVSPMAWVSPTARLGEDVDIHPFATIGDDVTIGSHSTIHSGVQIMAGSQIGEQATIFPNAVLYENTVVGPRSIIHANSVLGAYGFGYDQVGGRHCLSAQLGNVESGPTLRSGRAPRSTAAPTALP